MSGFISLTGTGEDTSIRVNIDQIVYYFERGNHHTAVLLSNGDFIYVKESPEAIENLISLCKK